jgi:hypothetical protein
MKNTQKSIHRFKEANTPSNFSTKSLSDVSKDKDKAEIAYAEICL